MSRLRKSLPWLATGGCGCTTLVGGGAALLGVVVGVGLYVAQSRWQAAAQWMVSTHTGGEVELGQTWMWWGGLTAHDVVVQSSSGVVLAEIETVTVRADLGALTGSASSWAIQDITFSGVTLSLEVDAAGNWSLPDTTLKLLAGQGALPIPPVSVETLTLEDVLGTVSLDDAVSEVRLERGALRGLTLDPSGAPPVNAEALSWEGLAWAREGVTVRLASGRLELPAFDLPDLGFSWSGLQGSDLALTFEEDVVEVERLEVEESGVLRLSDDAWSLGGVTLESVAAALTWREGLPLWVATQTALEGAGLEVLPELSVPEVRVVGAGATIEGTSGPLRVQVEELAGHNAVVAPLALGAAQTGPVTLYDGDRQEPWATVEQVSLAPGGAVLVQGAWAQLEVLSDRTVRLPAVVEEVLPAWLGGSSVAAARAPWWGIDLSHLPYAWKQLELRGAHLRLVDGAFAGEPVVWEVGVALTAGPSSEERLPFHGVFQLAEGQLLVEGGLNASIDIDAGVTLASLNLARFDPYAAEVLDKHQLVLGAGRLSGRPRLRLRGSQFTLTGPFEVDALELSSAEGAKSTKASVANAGFQLATGGDGRMAMELTVPGDLQDPNFSVTRAVMKAVIESVVEDPAKDTVDDVVEATKESVDSMSREAKKLGESLGLRRRKKKK